jgi:hypothetical protein
MSGNRVSSIVIGLIAGGKDFGTPRAEFKRKRPPILSGPSREDVRSLPPHLTGESKYTDKYIFN